MEEQKTITKKEAQIVCLIVKENKDEIIELSNSFFNSGNFLWCMVDEYTSNAKERNKVYFMLKAFLVNCLAKGLESYK